MVAHSLSVRALAPFSSVSLTIARRARVETQSEQDPSYFLPIRLQQPCSLALPVLLILLPCLQPLPSPRVIVVTHGTPSSNKPKNGVATPQ